MSSAPGRRPEGRRELTEITAENVADDLERQADMGASWEREAAAAIRRLIESEARLRAALGDFVALGAELGWDRATTGRQVLMQNAYEALEHKP